MDLYQELIIDHSQRPRHFGKLENATHAKRGYNPLCGDDIEIFLILDQNLRLKKLVNSEWKVKSMKLRTGTSFTSNLMFKS
jgi:hypothetical protein